MRKSPEERFWAKVRKSEDLNGCWEWIAYKVGGGYGKFGAGGRMLYAHRWAYEHLVGPISPELECDHLCRNPGCVNPAHIELVTHKENVLRGTAPSAQKARQTTCKNGHPLVARWGQRGCPLCRAEQKRVREAANREKITAQHRVWEAAHREQRSAQGRARYAANREKRLAQTRARYVTNREKISAQQREYRACRRAKLKAGSP